MKTAALRKVVWPEIERALEAPDGRVLVQDKASGSSCAPSPTRCGWARWARPISCWGTTGRSHFLQAQARDGGAITVARLRRWMDEPQRMGLPNEVMNLVALSFAGQTNRSFFLNNGPFPATLDNLMPELELREQALPDRAGLGAGARAGGSPVRPGRPPDPERRQPGQAGGRREREGQGDPRGARQPGHAAWSSASPIMCPRAPLPPG